MDSASDNCTMDMFRILIGTMQMLQHYSSSISKWQKLQFEKPNDTDKMWLNALFPSFANTGRWFWISGRKLLKQLNSCQCRVWFSASIWVSTVFSVLCERTTCHRWAAMFSFFYNFQFGCFRRFFFSESQYRWHRWCWLTREKWWKPLIWEFNASTNCRGRRRTIQHVLCHAKCRRYVDQSVDCCRLSSIDRMNCLISLIPGLRCQW